MPVFSIMSAEEDEDYKEINGKWLNEEPYGVVHRVASTGIVRGAASFCLDWAYAQTQNLRMDTYSDNIPHAETSGKMRISVLRFI